MRLRATAAPKAAFALDCEAGLPKANAPAAPTIFEPLSAVIVALPEASVTVELVIRAAVSMSMSLTVTAKFAPTFAAVTVAPIANE